MQTLFSPTKKKTEILNCYIISTKEPPNKFQTNPFHGSNYNNFKHRNYWCITKIISVVDLCRSNAAPINLNKSRKQLYHIHYKQTNKQTLFSFPIDSTNSKPDLISKQYPNSPNFLNNQKRRHFQRKTQNKQRFAI